MKKLKDRLRTPKQRILFIVLCAALLTASAFLCDKFLFLSAEEVGIPKLSAEDITEASFETMNPPMDVVYTDYERVAELVNTLEGATFVPRFSDRLLFGISLINLTANGHTYSIGLLGSAFVVNVDGKPRYYRCSTQERRAFQIIFNDITHPYALDPSYHLC